MPTRDPTQEKLTRADALRELLRQCELKVVALKGIGAEAMGFLHLMDEAQSLFDELEAKGVDLRAERSRWETIHQQLRSRMDLFVREAQLAGGLAQLRQTSRPAPERWWWFLDEEVHRQRRRIFRRVVIGGAVGLLVMAIAGLLYQRFLAPDPLTKQALQLAMRAEQSMLEGHLEEALATYETLRTLTPNDPEVLLRLGVLYEVLQRHDDASKAYARAQDLLHGQEDFVLKRGMIYLGLGRWDSAQADAEVALTLNPESALSYFILGNVYEAQGQISKAAAALTQAAELAIDQGNDSLYALIKIRLGVLMGGSGGVRP